MNRTALLQILQGGLESSDNSQLQTQGSRVLIRLGSACTHAPCSRTHARHALLQRWHVHIFSSLSTTSSFYAINTHPLKICHPLNGTRPRQRQQSAASGHSRPSFSHVTFTLWSTLVIISHTFQSCS